MENVNRGEIRAVSRTKALDRVNPYLWKRSSQPRPLVTSVVASQLGLPVNINATQATVLLSRMSPDERTAHGLGKVQPPEGIHWMGFRSGVFLDLGGADELASALDAAGYAFKDGGRYLDFGCSSGRTLRTFRMAYPGVEWHGADPDPETIKWAQASLPGISFITSPQLPPVPYADNFFNGVYAISVWSHFREDAARAWFTEMRRLIRSDGFLMFTTPGYARYANRLRLRPQYARRIVKSLLQFQKSGFVFAASYAKRGNRTLDTTMWGVAQISLAWVTKNLIGSWALRKMIPAGNRNQQDIYVLQPVKE